MFSKQLNSLLIITLVLALFGQGLTLGFSNENNNLVNTATDEHSVVLADNPNGVESEDSDCCDTDCCDENCLCLGHSCSTAAFVTNLGNTLPTPILVVSDYLHKHSLPNFIVAFPYRPPIIA